MSSCTHLDLVRVAQTSKYFCEDCIKTHHPWVDLRMCLTCGHVGCCDASKNRHACWHFWHTGHPLVRSAEPGEAWVWCYLDDVTPGELEVRVEWSGRESLPPRVRDRYAPR
jgi:uncharacterized UBP type Zn finger protein